MTKLNIFTFAACGKNQLGLTILVDLVNLVHLLNHVEFVLSVLMQLISLGLAVLMLFGKNNIPTY